jgi:DNA-binding transcriptional ArsR family regulator
MSHGAETDLSLITAETARSVAETMQALATPSRVRILSRLAAGPCTVGELTRELAMGQPAVSQQLRVLRHLGLVIGQRDGRNVLYALHDEHVRTPSICASGWLPRFLSSNRSQRMYER